MFVSLSKVNLIILKLSMRLHFLDVLLNCQILKGNIIRKQKSASEIYQLENEGEKNSA